jgi:hypothetical protein
MKSSTSGSHSRAGALPILTRARTGRTVGSRHRDQPTLCRAEPRFGRGRTRPIRTSTPSLDAGSQSDSIFIARLARIIGGLLLYQLLYLQIPVGIAERPAVILKGNALIVHNDSVPASEPDA